MVLDSQTCRRARLARDARFDGRFFVGVKTTGVFCRPICPAVPPREANVEYFPSAAAAVEAGFRACLRCRPECAPGTPAWSGASTTVARGLRLIGQGALEDDNLDALAERLGVGSRHLRRLFVEHLGAAPIAVVQTQRLLSAKTLIDGTDLPLTTIAMAAGFRSVRRFNAAFQERYGRSPSSLRKVRHGRAANPARYTFDLRYRPPFDWPALVSFIERRAIPGVEAVNGGCYQRTIVVGAHTGWIDVRPGGANSLRLEVELADSGSLLGVVARVRRMFDLDADPMAIDDHLATDSLLEPLVRKRPGLRVPGAWDWFELAVRAILGQQVSVRGATTLSGRLVRQFGRPLPQPLNGLTHAFPHPADIADADIARIGMPAKRAEAIRQLAVAAAAGELAGDGTMEPEEFTARLLQIPGIGPWTAAYIAMRALGDPDAFPVQDLGLLRGAGCRTASALQVRSQAWRPWRAYAALHIWSQDSTRDPAPESSQTPSRAPSRNASRRRAREL